MEILKYLTAIKNYYKLSTTTFGNDKTKRKIINIEISRKISKSGLILWAIVSLFMVIFTMGADSVNSITLKDGGATVTYNKFWWVYIIAAIIVMLLTILKSLTLFRKLEHKPLNLNIYQREMPSNLRPAHVRLLLNDGLVEEVSLAATLLDLIDRGYLAIDKYENKQSIFRNKEIVLRKIQTVY